MPIMKLNESVFFVPYFLFVSHFYIFPKIENFPSSPRAIIFDLDVLKALTF